MNKITVENVYQATKVNFDIVSHPEKRLVVNPYRNKSKSLAIITFIGIADRCNVSIGECCEFLRIEKEMYFTYLDKFDLYIQQAKTEIPIDYKVSADVELSCQSIAFRKAKLVSNYLRNYFRTEIVL